MAHASLSSGDLLADRRYGYAQDLLAEGNNEAAADLLTQVIERVADWAPAWIGLAAAEERQGRRDEAIQAYARADSLDSAGLFGAKLHLGRLRGEPPATMPSAYVAALFDGYAPRFDQHLLGSLGYRAPAVLVETLDRLAGGRRFAHALDLGCGTGLMAAAIMDRVERIDGVDLAGAMLTEAARGGHYAQLHKAEIVEFLTAAVDGSFDLVLAADVFAYLGELGPVLGHMARILSSGGLAAFTVQQGPSDTIRLGADLRFSHSAAYVANAVAAAGLDVVSLCAGSVRREKGIDVPGLVVLARQP